MTSWNIILNFFRNEECLENDFCLMDGYMFISEKKLTFSLFYGVMSKSSLSLILFVRVLIIICCLPIHMINLEGSSIFIFINFV